MKYIKCEEFCLPCMLGHGNDGVWIVPMYLQKQTKHIVKCRVQINFSCSSIFSKKKYELMENPKNISRTFPLQHGSSQTHGALRWFGFNGFFSF